MIDENRVRAAAFRISAGFEGDNYQAYEYSNDAIIRYGRFSFTLAFGALACIVDRYLSKSTTATALSLRPYQNRISAGDPALRADGQLRDLLVAAGNEPLMQVIQDEEALRAWEATWRVAITPRAIQTALAQALLFDIGVNFGVGDGLLRMAEREFDVRERSRVGENGLGETQLIMRVAEMYRLLNEQRAAQDNRPDLRVRGKFWLDRIRQGDWQLETDRPDQIVASSTPIQLTQPAIAAAASTASPESAAQALFVTPIHNHTRVRSRPLDGDTIGAVVQGEFVEVLEPYDQAVAKLGNKSQWLHIRTSNGLEGYSGAWLYTSVQEMKQGEQPLWIVPTDDRIRIRTRPIDGETAAVISRGDVLEVLEPYPQAIDKLGREDQWLYVRTPDGSLGYTAAWFYTAQQTSQPTPQAAVPEPLPVPLPMPTPDVMLITPANDRVRVRARPKGGDTVGIVSQGDVLQVLDSRVDALKKIGISGEWLYVRLPDGEEGYGPASQFILHHTLTNAASSVRPSDQPLRITPTDDRVRIRAQSIIGEVVGVVARGDVLEVLDSPDEARQKLGVEDQWLHVIAPDGSEGFTAARFFQPFDGPLPDWTIEGNMTGVNLDLFHPFGTPDPAQLGQIGWVRLVYNLSLDPDKPESDPSRYGNVDLEGTFQRYYPMLKCYADAGIKVMLELTEKTFGEGAGYPWGDMNSTQWRDMAFRFAQIAGRIAAQFREEHIVPVYQIWHGMDALSDPPDPASMPPQDYAYLLAQSIRAIRNVDPEALIITGGHTSALDKAVQYAQQTLVALPQGVRPDGIALHPYGRGDSQSELRFASCGLIDDEVNAFAELLPGWPVWITEWGVCDVEEGESPEAVARYAREFLERLKKLYAHKVTAAIWFPWAQGMGSGYGIVDEHGAARRGFAEELIIL